MTTPHLPARLLGFGTLALTCLLLPACKSKEESVELVPVAGKVTVAGAPLPMGQVTFHPDADKGNTTDKAPIGMIELDGSYKLVTGTSSGTREGAPPGWYKVTVVVSGPATSDQAKLKAPTFNQEFSRPKLTKLLIEVKQGAGPKAYDLPLTK